MTLQPPRDPSPLRVSHGYMVILAAGMFTACRNDKPTTAEGAGHDLDNVMVETCTVCDIDLDSVQTLIEPYVGMRTASLQSSSASGSARIVIAPGAEPYTLTLLEPGSPNAPTLRGREGEGPGEFRRIRAAAPYRGDSLVVLEAVDVAIVAADSLRGRRLRLPGGTQSFTVQTLDDSAIVVNSYLPGSPLVTVLGPDGRVMAALDSLPGGVTAAELDAERRRLHIAVLPDGDLLVVPAQFTFAVTRWNPSTGATRVVSLHPSWFRAWTAADRDAERAAPGHAPPITLVQDVHVDARGRVWLMGRVPARDFVPVSGEVTPTVDLWNEWADTIIEVYDPTTGERLGAARSDVLLGGFIGDSLAYRRTVDADGVVSVTLLRLSAE